MIVRSVLFGLTRRYREAAVGKQIYEIERKAKTRLVLLTIIWLSGMASASIEVFVLLSYLP